MARKADGGLILKNTMSLYLRMFVSLVVSLYASRVIVGYLGVSDHGLYNVVAGAVTLLAFVNSSMAVSVQRFLSFEMGSEHGSQDSLDRIYSTSVLIHFLIAVAIFLVIEALGWHFINTDQIPPDRMSSARILFHLSALSCCIGFMQVPNTALVIASEKMEAYAYISIMEAFLKLGILFLLPVLPFDRLVSYGGLLLGVTIVITLSYAAYTHFKIKGVRFKAVWDGGIFRRLLTFALWSMLGEASWAAVGQGVTLVINWFFPLPVNSARAFAQQVNVALKNFVQNFQTAMNPQIIKLYAADERGEMFRLTFKGTKLSYYLMLIISLPFLFNMEYVLGIWLPVVPPYTAVFARLAIIGSLVDIISNLLATVAKATGKIRRYQTVVSIALFMNLPLSWAVLRCGAPVWTVYLVYIAVSLSLIFIRIHLVDSLVRVDRKRFLRDVVLPVVKVTAASAIIPLLCWRALEGGLWNFVLTSLLSVLSVAACVFFIGTDEEEKLFIFSKLHIRR